MAHILIIEDNEANMELMAYLLQAFGHVVQEAMEGKAGLELAMQGSFDLILCDLQMPGMDGYEVMRRIKLDLSAVPMVAVTAYAMVGDRDRVLAAGFDGYIAKPINPETFAGEIEEFLPPQLRFGKI
jgi:two-component system cell cycle response regulator